MNLFIRASASLKVENYTPKSVVSSRPFQQECRARLQEEFEIVGKPFDFYDSQLICDRDLL